MRGNSIEVGLMLWRFPKYRWFSSRMGIMVFLCLGGFLTSVEANEYRSREELDNLRDRIDSLQQRLDTEREKETLITSDLLDIEKQSS